MRSIYHFTRSTVSYLTGILFVVDAFLIVGGYVWAYLVLRGITSLIILHFNEYSGITQSGTLLDLLGVELLAFAGIVTNLFIVVALEEHDRDLGRIITTITFIMSLLIFIGFRVIIAIN